MQQFALSRLDLTHAPVPVDPTVIHTLRSQLHTFKKCFSGKEFVEKLLKLGREAEALKKAGPGSSEPVTPSPQIAMQRSPGGKIVYNIQYAKEVGQFLLSERSLLPLPSLRQESSECDSDEGQLGEEEEEEKEGVSPGSRLHESSSIQSDQRVRRVEGGRGLGVNPISGAAGLTVGGHINNSKNSSPEIVRVRRSACNYQTELQPDTSTPQLVIDLFLYSPQSMYKFSDVEDFETRALYHSQILTASAHPEAASGMDETSVFERARMGMLFLVYDLLLQRARREKRVKHFLQTPRALNIADRRKRQYVDCNLIFKL